MILDTCRLDIILLLIANFCRVCCELKFIIEEPPLRNMLKITRNKQTIFLDIDNDSTVNLKDSVLKSIHRDQPVLLLNVLPEMNVKIRRLVQRNTNIVFTTKYLDENIFDTPFMMFMLRSQLSVLFIIVTIEDSSYKCVQGKLNEEATTDVENFLNYLWYKHRIIRVLLHLPYVCPEEYIVYNATKPTDGELYNRTVIVVRRTDEQLLSEIISIKFGRMLTRNYPLRANIFYRFPTAIQNCSGTDMYVKTSEKYSGGFCGLDGLVMSDIVRHFEFNLSLPELPPGYDKYGYQREDGVITGSLGHVVQRDVDISFNSRFIVRYTNGSQKYRYLSLISYDSLCAVLNQPDEEPLWQYPINSYTLPQWLFITVCFTAIGTIMWVFAKIRKNMHNTNVTTLKGYILNAVNAGLFGFFIKPRGDLLTLRASCLLASILVLAKYQSYINYIFTTRVRYDTLNSLSDLAESEIMIQVSPSIYTFINESINEIGRTLLSRTIVLEDTDSFQYVTQHKNTATLERQIDAIMLTWMSYTDGTGRPLLYVVNECSRFFYLSYIANLEFPFTDIISMFMMRLVETGLPDMYYLWTCRALGLQVTLPNLYSEPRPASAITLDQQVIPFGVLLMGYGLAVTAFVVEVRLARRQTYPCVC